MRALSRNTRRVTALTLTAALAQLFLQAESRMRCRDAILC